MLIWQLGRGMVGCYNQRHESEVIRMTTFTGYFDGRTIMPDEAVDLPRDQRLVFHVEDVRRSPQLPQGKTLEEMLAAAKEVNFPKEDLKEIQRAIDEDCEKVDSDGW